MLWKIFIILVVLWVVGIVPANILGGFLHLFLVIGVIILLFSIVTSRKPVI